MEKLGRRDDLLPMRQPQAIPCVLHAIGPAFDGANRDDYF